MKKFLLMLLCVIIALPAMSVTRARIGDLYYNLDDKHYTAEIYGYYNINGNIAIPRQVQYGIATYSVTSIGEAAFKDCASLTNVEIPPYSITSIGTSAFSGTGLTSIEIPNSVTSIGSGVFSSCSSLSYIYVDPANSNYSSQDGVLYNKDKTQLIQCPGTKEFIKIPDMVSEVGISAFKGCTNLTSITIPNSVTNIEYAAFANCSSLNDITFEDGEETLKLGCLYSVSSGLGSGLFEDCPLERVYIGRNLSYSEESRFGYSPFSNQKNLSEVTISHKVTNLGKNFFL